MHRQSVLWPRYLIVTLVAFAALVALTLAAPSEPASEAVRELEATGIPHTPGETLSLGGETLVVTNLVGGIEILPADGSHFEVEIQFRGEAGDQLRALSKEGDTSEVAIEFPVDRVRKYRYPDAGRLQTSFTLPLRRQGSTDWVSMVFQELGSSRIHVSDRRGTAMWADLTVRVPQGKTLEVVLGVGKIEASGVVGDLRLDSHGGPIRVARVEGSVLADTGSGRIEGEEIHGRVNFDTGSGSVSLKGARGESVQIDTGSGTVTLVDVDSQRLHVDTGSGGVKGEQLGADDLRIDTGSGSVTAEFVRFGTGKFVFDTGSGGVRLGLPRGASARIEADTGSGGIGLDLDDATIQQKERDQVKLRLGEGAARVTIDTGSGPISIGYV